MEQIVFRGGIEGLDVEQVIRDHDYSMITRHFHDTYELYYLLEGQRYYFIDKQTYLVKAGDVVLIRPNQIHKTSMAGGSYHNRILFQISSRLMDPFLKACGMGNMKDVYAEDAMIISIPDSEQKEFTELIIQIQKEFDDRPRQYLAGIKLKMAQLLLYLTRYQKKASFQQESQKVQTWKHQKVHEVADYLLNHPQSQESLEQLARRFYISKSYLSRIFREITGFSVNEYKNVNRIKRSQQLLIHSEYSVTEISDLMGFENLTYYERVFKKYAGTTPLKYRRTVISP